MVSFFKKLLNKSDNRNKKMDYLQEKYSKDIETYRINKSKKEELVEPIFNHLHYIEFLEKTSEDFHQEENYDEEFLTLKKCANYCFENELVSEKIYNAKNYYNIIYHAKLYCNRKINILNKEQDALYFKAHSYEKYSSDDYASNENNYQKTKSVKSSRITYPVITNKFVLDVIELYFNKIYEQEFRKELKIHHLEKYIGSQEINGEINNSKRKRKLYSYLVKQTKNDEIVDMISSLINNNYIINEQQIIKLIQGYDLELKKYKLDMKNKLVEINERNVKDNIHKDNKRKNRLNNYLLRESSEPIIVEVLTSMINDGFINNKQQIMGIIKLVESKHNERIRSYQKQERKEELKLNIGNYKTQNLQQKTKRKSIPNRIRHQVFQRDNYRCRECGARLEDGATLEIDHIIPVTKGGTNDIDNLQTLCKDCNRGKYTDTWIGGKR